jgi:hypothetical protein
VKEIKKFLDEKPSIDGNRLDTEGGQDGWTMTFMGNIE